MTRTVAAGVGALFVLAAALAGSVGAAGSASDVRLSVKGLPKLSGAVYELWVVYGNEKLSAGTFNVSGGKVAGRLSSPRDPRGADALAVTIEPRGDRNRAPSATVILAGKPSGSAARLTFPLKLDGVGGSYLLATPTDDDDTNETAGIWFLTTASKASLRLPAAPAGWAWEGWGVTQGKPLSTGRFRKPAGADQAAPYSGPKGAPPFPGEDFLRRLPAGTSTPVDLADGESQVVITLEPDLRGKDPTGSGPFAIKPLAHRVPAGTKDHRSLNLRRDLSALPAATARF